MEGDGVGNSIEDRQVGDERCEGSGDDRVDNSFEGREDIVKSQAENDDDWKEVKAVGREEVQELCPIVRFLVEVGQPDRWVLNEHEVGGSMTARRGEFGCWSR